MDQLLPWDEELIYAGHNDHTNEVRSRAIDHNILMTKFVQPSHHIPYLYSMAGAASNTQSRVREIAQTNYNASVNGLSGVRYPLIASTSRILTCVHRTKIVVK